MQVFVSKLQKTKLYNIHRIYRNMDKSLQITKHNYSELLCTSYFLLDDVFQELEFGDEFEVPWFPDDLHCDPPLLLYPPMPAMAMLFWLLPWLPFGTTTFTNCSMYLPACFIGISDPKGILNFLFWSSFRLNETIVSLF